MKFIDLFAGIGGFRTGLEMNGHECVAFCEIDKYARQSYKAIYDTKGEEEWHDITKVSNNDFRSFRGRADIITGGFPCQAFSIAGNRRGFEDTRGTLFFEIARAIKEIQPSYALLENVKGLFSHDKGRTFGTIIQALDELGYVVEWGLFNSKYWGVPQNRERVFILATRKDVFKQPKLIDLLNEQTEVNTRLLDLIEDEVDEKYYLSGEKANKLIAMIDEKHKVKDRVVVDGTINEPKVKEVMNTVVARYDAGVSNQKSMGGMVIEPKTVQPVLTPDRMEKRQNGRRFKEDGEPMFTLTAQDKHGIAIKEATKKGYTVAEPGDSVNIAYPDSKTRRGRVGNQIANTLLTGEEQAVVLGGVYTNDSIDFHRGLLNGLSRTLKSSNHDAGVVLGVGHHPFSKKREFNGYGDLSPTLIATDYKAPKTVLLKEGQTIKDCNYYAKDNIVVSEEVFSEDPFEYDYEYINAELRQIGEYYLLANQDGTQAEVLIELKDGVYETVRVIHDLDEITNLEHITPKDSMGRMGEQAIETFIANSCVQGDTINAYNRTVDKSGLSPTLTTRPEGFKTAILPITGELRIRKLTPLECWRLQGFTDEQFYKAKNDGVSNSQLYKQAGNSVTVNVIDAIAKML